MGSWCAEAWGTAGVGAGIGPSRLADVAKYKVITLSDGHLGSSQAISNSERGNETTFSVITHVWNCKPNKIYNS